MPSNVIGASTTGGNPARAVTVEIVSRTYGNSVFGHAMPSSGPMSCCGTLRIWNTPACAASTRNMVLSLILAVMVTVSTTSI